MIQIGSYRFPADRSYDAEHHLWSQREPSTGRVRVGMDMLGLESLGDIVFIALQPVGTRIRRGQPLGTLEAAKMTGEIVSPLSGIIVEHNRAVLQDAHVVNRDPYEEGWLVRLQPLDWPAEAETLIGPEHLGDWARREITRYREQGWIS
ncbi:MAG TPA: glycine cleavage system protein H [bacterium]|nr:glycine cleavage system protein H [bacterium]